MEALHHFLFILRAIDLDLGLSFCVFCLNYSEFVCRRLVFCLFSPDCCEFD